MAWFRCSLGGSGGLELTVTCDFNFAGLTITCTDGDTTLTKVCPSQSPYQVVFNLPNGGTWTISGVVSGKTQSTTVVIPDNAALHVIPTGSAATPVNDIQTWLHCGNIWDKTYTTINQVLSDTTTLLALVSSNNAADYMARSTNWASSVCANQTAMGYIGNNDYCANKLLANSTWATAICNSTYFESVLTTKVPTMTSNTAPSGEAYVDTSVATIYSGQAYMAFDGNDNTGIAWQDNSYANDSYTFPNAMMLKKYRFYCRFYGSGRVYTVKVQGSNNGTTWNDLDSFTVTANNTTLETIRSIPTNNTKYKKHRLYSTTTKPAGQNFDFLTIQFWGR